MDEKFIGILRNSVTLAKEVQPLIEKQANCRSLATVVSDALVRYNVIDIEKRAEVEKELADPEYAYDLIIKLASKLPVDTLGEPGEQFNSSAGLTPEENFERWLLNS